MDKIDIRLDHLQREAFAMLIMNGNGAAKVINDIKQCDEEEFESTFRMSKEN